MIPVEKSIETSIAQFCAYWNLDSQDPVISCPAGVLPETGKGLPDNVVYIFGK